MALDILRNLLILVLFLISPVKFRLCSKVSQNEIALKSFLLMQTCLKRPWWISPSACNFDNIFINVFLTFDCGLNTVFSAEDRRQATPEWVLNPWSLLSGRRPLATDGGKTVPRTAQRCKSRAQRCRKCGKIRVTTAATIMLWSIFLPKCTPAANVIKIKVQKCTRKQPLSSSWECRLNCAR